MNKNEPKKVISAYDLSSISKLKKGQKKKNYRTRDRGKSLYDLSNTQSRFSSNNKSK